jgi:hypothetical protein
MTYGAAGVWLDAFWMRLGNVHSASWNAENPELCAKHRQQARRLSRLLRQMTRSLKRLDVAICPDHAREQAPPAGQLALQEIACQAGAAIANLRATGHACHDEALSALKDALLDENEELLGEWIKTTNCQKGSTR